MKKTTKTITELYPSFANESVFFYKTHRLGSLYDVLEHDLHITSHEDKFFLNDEEITEILLRGESLSSLLPITTENCEIFSEALFESRYEKHHAFKIENSIVGSKDYMLDNGFYYDCNCHWVGDRPSQPKKVLPYEYINLYSLNSKRVVVFIGEIELTFDSQEKANAWLTKNVLSPEYFGKTITITTENKVCSLLVS